MSLADLRKKSSTLFATDVLNKVKTKKQAKTAISSSNSLLDKITKICKLVNEKLGKYKEQFEIVTDINVLKNYINEAIKNDELAIDTETTGLNPIDDKIVGLCLYTPSLKPVYVPINHISLISKVRLTNQLTNEQVAECLKVLIGTSTKLIYFNAKFDIRVIKNQLGIDLSVYWDSAIAARVLKENELENSLKYLWTKYCCKEDESEYFTFEKFFKGYTFDLIPIDTAVLYAAKDPLMTYELYKFQEPYLTQENEVCKKCGFEKLASLYRNIELPIIKAVAEIEDNGITINKEYAKELSVKYRAILEQKLEDFNKVLQNYKDQIIQYKSTHKSCIENPINLNSPKQLGELFYDILKVESISKKEPRGTGEDILKKLNHPLCEPISAYREVNKLLTTYIEKLPEVVSPTTQKVHCNFKQIGTDTGRFASSDPNLQNIPAHNKDIRLMFEASKEEFLKSKDKVLEGLMYDYFPFIGKYSQDLVIGDEIVKDVFINNITKDEFEIKLVLNNDCKVKITRINILIGSDYSQQEPKITAELSGDEEFIRQCAEGKDAYGIIASITYGLPYEECLEFFPDGSYNKEGDGRRAAAKKVLLAICYGKTNKTLAEDLGVPEEKAQEITDSILRSIPSLKRFMQESQDNARKYGYVETMYGRRRYLPNMQLEPYEIKAKGAKSFDPFFDSEELGVVNDIERLKQKYITELTNAKWYKQKRQIKEQAEKDGFQIVENTKLIEDAKRKCVNSRVQGSAADQTKIALQNIYVNETMKKIKWKTLLLIHDEIIGECPLIYAKTGGETLVKCMLDAAKDIRAGAKCDETYQFRWYDDKQGKEIKIDNMSQSEIFELVEQKMKEVKGQ